MRRLSHVLPAAFLIGLPVVASAQNGSGDATFSVSVQVVRSCSITSQHGQGAVQCGSPSAPSAAVDPGAPRPRVTEPAADSTSGVVTIEF